jgi:Prenyltransferase and squalene oxidase repeat
MSIPAYRQAAVRAVKWLLTQQNDDGSMGPVEQGVGAYYKVPYAFSLAGRTVEAGRLLAWVRTNAFTEEGDFGGRYPRIGPHQTYYHYANSWMVAGVQRLGQFDLAFRGVDFLLTMQHPQCGGFLAEGPDAHLSGEQDLMSTSVAGLACLYTGRVAEATAVGDHLVRVWGKQPVPSSRLYFSLRNGEDLVTDFPEEEAPQRVIDTKKDGQWYLIPGLATAFLVRLWMATGNREYLAAAHEYTEFCDLCAQDRYTTLMSGAFGWGAALLYQATGNANHQRIAAAVADYVVSTQNEDGTWGAGGLGEEYTYLIMDATAEFAVMLVEIAEGLAAGE